MAQTATLKLTVIEGPDTGSAITYAGERMVIGRGKAADLALTDTAVSRSHTAVEREAGVFVLVDLGSANGTFVMGESARITRRPLATGDEFTLGRTRVRVEVMPPPDAGATAVLTRAERVAAMAAPPPPPKAAPKAAPPGLDAQTPPDLPIVLSVLVGADRGMVYSPYKQVIAVGRLPTADVPLNDPAVSRLHATIKREGNGYWVYDENSLNGTWLGNPPEEVFHAELENGDVLTVGETQLRVDIGAAGARIENLDETTLTGTLGDNTLTMTIPGLGARVPAPRLRVRPDEKTVLIRQPRKKLLLLVTAGPDANTVFEPKREQKTFTVGRGEAAIFRLSDPGISGVHFSITSERGGFVLKDEDSRNGTFLGGTRVTTVPLDGGETIRLGTTEIRAQVVVEGAHRVAPGEATIVTPAPEAPAPGGPAPASATEPAAIQKTEQPKPGAEKKRGEEIVPELARSAEAKERISKIMKGVSLRPIRVPGTPRQWASLGMVLLAALVSLGFSLRWPGLLAAGPLAEDHADLESRDGCASCHAGVTWTSTNDHMAMSARCATTGCHVEDLKNRPGVNDDCVSCHTEHRGRSFPIAGGAAQCWSCHVGQEEPRDFRTRLMRAAVVTEPQERARLATAVPRVEIGLRFSHAAHEKETAGDVRYDTCVGCHPRIEQGRTFGLPSHGECLDCHENAVSADVEVAKRSAGDKCLECHTEKTGEMKDPPPRPFRYVEFSHEDHRDEFCKSCHAETW
ncbi:MAG: hypothetical protein QOD06_2134, partial [Candidatus Binatota bacterium]|nr:hypothetical protein [Candidatus Binatota bacterium]